MASITPERFAKLLEIYAGLKERIYAIDDKYSLDYVEPKVDLPESLNLEKMTHSPMTQEELNELAMQYVDVAILTKQRNLDSGYYTKIKTIARKRTELTVKLTDKLKQLDGSYADGLATLERKLVNNGLIFSTTATAYRDQAFRDYNQHKSDYKNTYIENVKVLNTEESDVEEVYQMNLDKLEEEKNALFNKKLHELEEKDAKAKASVDKYNNSIEEKEQRYQYSRSKFIETLRKNERDRVLTMTKLYMELGDVTFRDRILREKYATAQDVFWQFRREEAMALIEYDSFLSYHLEKYYSTFVDWVNSYLLPFNKD